MNTNPRAQAALAVALVLLGAALRLVDHPWNVTPIVAIALLSGAYLEKKRWALIAPLSAMLLSDLALQVLAPERGLHAYMPVIYASYACVVGLGLLLGRVRQPWKFALCVAPASLAASAFFFLVSNFVVWLSWGMYPMTWDGLVQCYAAAIPFNRLAPLGDLAYTVLFFSTYAAITRFAPGFAASRASAAQG